MAPSIKAILALAFALPFALAAPTQARSSKIVSFDDKVKTIPGKYIVVFAPGANKTAIATHRNSIRRLTKRDGNPVSIGADYDMGNFKGYSIEADQAAIERIAATAEVDYIEPDQMMYASAITTQSDATWGLGRISTKEKGSTTYSYDDTAGSGAYVYVVDTGIYLEHEEFEGRATFGATFIDGKENDGQGHGTHCAGTIGGKTYGISKKTKLIAVKVLGDDGSGSNSGVISGMQWVAKDAASKNATSKSVLSMSLGGDFSAATNSAVKSVFDSGVTVVVAAGNENVDAGTTSPASEPSAITVAAADKNDARSVWTGGAASNFGTLVDVFAPGTDVLSAGIEGTTSTATHSGTSMACPHVAGLAAYLIVLEGLTSPSAVAARIKELAQKDLLTDVSGSPNLLAYNGSGA